MTSVVIDGIEVGRCVTSREVAQRLGISVESARRRLRRLERSGAVERRMVGRTAVYCAKEESVLLSRPLVRGLGVKTRQRIKQVCGLLEREGCVPTATLVRMFGVDSGAVFYLMKHVMERGAVKVGIGNTALWCRNRTAAEELVSRIRETVHRLSVENKMRYATPAKVLQAVLKDRDAYALLSRFIPLKRNMEKFPPAALTFVDAVLRSLYGEPLRYRRRTVYIVTQPRGDYIVNVTDRVETRIVQVKLPDDLASALGDDVDKVVLQAIENLIQKFRT
jgi:DNA-binding Lrp family transcriptional regulator